MSRPPNTALAIGFAFLIPGAGHLMLGRRIQAAVFFLVITLTFAGGMALADFTNVSFARYPFHFLAQVFAGGEMFLALLLTSGLKPTHVPEFLGVNTLDIGLLYTMVAALLNVMVMMHLWNLLIGDEDDAAARRARRHATPPAEQVPAPTSPPEETGA